MRFHVLGHVEADQFDAQLHRQLLGHLGLAHAGGAGEQEIADRLVRVAQAAARQLDRRGQAADRLVLAEDHHLQVALEVLQHVLVGRADLLGRDPRHLGDDGLDLLHVDQVLARFRREQALARAGLVDHVDRLVGQQAVADVLDRQVHGRLDRLVGIAHAVVGFVLRLQALQDLDRLAHGRLDDVDLLEAPGQRAILLEDPAVFLEGGRADAAQLAAGQHRLDQVGGVHGPAAGGTGADDGVDLVDEQDRVRQLLQRRQHALQALLEIAAVLGAGDQRAEVERVDHRLGQHLGHVALDDALGQAFGQRGLAHAGLAHVERVVLAPAAQHLDGALDFLRAPDQRVDLAGRGQLVEVAGELGQRVGLRLALAALGLALAFLRLRGRLVLGAGDAVRDVVDDVEPVHVLLVEEVHRVGILLAEDGDQHVGAGHFLLAGGLHVVDRALQHPLEAQRRLGVAAIVFGELVDRDLDGLLQLLAQAREIGADRLEHGLGRGIVEQREHQVLDGHELVARLAGALVALADAVLEVLAEHGGCPPER